MTPTQPGDPGREHSAPPLIADIARWIGGDMHAAYRAHQWAVLAWCTVIGQPGAAAWCGLQAYALGHLHALEALTGRTVPRE